MQTAVIYCRYSSDSQTEQSIDGQLRVCTEYAKSRDILILDTYIDRAMTGTNDNRPDFQRMIKDSAKRTGTCSTANAKIAARRSIIFRTTPPRFARTAERL